LKSVLYGATRIVSGKGAKMIGQTIAILEDNRENAELGETIEEAIRIVSVSSTVTESGPSGPGQPSRTVADLYDFRRRIGYWRQESIVGLDETEKSLREYNSSVCLRVLETNLVVIAIWLDNNDAPIGVIIAAKRGDSIDRLESSAKGPG